MRGPWKGYALCVVGRMVGADFVAALRGARSVDEPATQGFTLGYFVRSLREELEPPFCRASGNYLHNSRVLAKYGMRGYIKLERGRVGIATPGRAQTL
jgi:hypothetical protein